MTTGRAILFVGTAVALALAARSLLGSPVPLWVSGSAFLAYAGLVTLGVLQPSLEMFGSVFWHRPEVAREVALTFDDRPRPRHTRSALDVLDQAGAQAQLFVLCVKGELTPAI